MMRTEILVIGADPDILQTILRLLNAEESWHADGVAGVKEALTKCSIKTYDVLLLGAGLTMREEEELKTELKRLYPALPVIPHYGGGSGLLFAEIYLALGKMNQAQ